MASFTVSGLTSVINQILPEPHAGLLAGLLYGTKASLSREFTDALTASGTIHIVALSGQNLSILASMVSMSLIWLIGRRKSLVLTFFLICWFVWFVGPSPTIVRAAIMSILSLFSVFTGKTYWPVFSWGLAVTGMLVLNISWLWDVSFQLSALATLGIILFGGTVAGDRQDVMARSEDAGDMGSASVPASGLRFPLQSFLLNRLLSKTVPVLKNDLRLTLAAQTLTIPVIFWHFRRLSLVSPFSNLAIGWIVPVISVWGWVTAIAGWIWMPLGQVCAWVAWLMLEYLIRVVSWFGNLPFTGISW